MDTLACMRGISQGNPMPIVVFAECGDKISINDALQVGVSAYVVDGLSPKRLNSIVEVAIARFRQYQDLRHELETIKNKLEERKLIDRAKGVLMKQKGMSEDDAYRALRKMAMDWNIKIGEAARNIISVAELFS